VRGGGGVAGRAFPPPMGPRGAAGGGDDVGAGTVAGRATTGAGAGATALASRVGTSTRRFFSTTTTLLRPCEKLCRTVPCSTGRFRCKVAFDPEGPRDLSPLLFVSLMRKSSNPGPNLALFG
jgi:hypothetical protein